MPRQTSSGSAPRDSSSGSSLGGFPVTGLQKAGVFVQKIVITTGTLTALPVLPVLSSSLMTEIMIKLLINLHFLLFQTWRYQAPTARQMPRPESPLDRASISSAGPKVQTPLHFSVIFVHSRHLWLSLFYLHLCLCVLGTYIRTSDGRIFAVRAANKPKTGEGNAASSPAKSKIIELNVHF